MSVEIFDVTHDSQSVISVTEAAAAHLLRPICSFPEFSRTRLAHGLDLADLALGLL